MLKTAALLAALLPALPAAADPVIDRAVDGVILPAFREFADRTAALSAAARENCLAADPALRATYDVAFDAWLAAALYGFGPLEREGRNLAIAFWPDPKGARPKALARLIAEDGAALSDPEAFARVSVAARGLFGLEAMLYDPAFNTYGPTDPGCRLTRAAADDLARTAATVAAEWEEFGTVMKTAGAPGNTRFLSPGEARQILYTAFLGGLQFDSEQRLGRPMGTDDRPRPARAEARDSERTVRNLRVSLAALDRLGHTLDSSTATEQTFRYLDWAREVADGITDPTLAGLDTPEGYKQALTLKRAIDNTIRTAKEEMGEKLGVGAGFNGLDGD